ncbi:MAG: GDP-mannose 4,6-dehydratase [Candidatus Omnitrophica bacterium]|nr:GDP-mannose 4,6-dehydratase [Candidatus Omnitrophota bacterium]
MFFKKQTILITGGAGFIGSHLAERLVSKGEKIIVLDDLSTGSYKNIEHLTKSNNFQIIVDSVLNENVVEDIVKSCDMVYHLAAAVGVRLIIEEPSKTIETNISGTESVLKMCSRYHKKFLMTSTSEVYGSGVSERFNEEDCCVIGPPNKRRWSYAASKLMDEHLAFSYWYEKQLPVIIVRLFNVIGPRQTGRYGMVVPTFIRQALDNEPLTVFGDGKQTRSFLSVNDAVKVLVDFMNNPKVIGGVFNIGSEEEINIEELAKMVIKITESSSSVKYVPYSEAYGEDFEDMRRRVPDVSKLKRINGFAPKEKLVDIIKNMVKLNSVNNQ